MRQFKKKTKMTPEEKIEKTKRDIEKKNYEEYLRRLAAIWSEK